MSSEIINPSQSQLRSLLPVSRPSVAKLSRSSKSETLIVYEKYHISSWKIARLVVQAFKLENSWQTARHYRRQAYLPPPSRVRSIKARAARRISSATRASGETN